MKKVLILEDEANIRSFVVINLKRAGYEAIEASTGPEALAQIEANPDIGVAILDIMVPEIDGFEVCRRIRATNQKMGICNTFSLVSPLSVNEEFIVQNCDFFIVAMLLMKHLIYHRYNQFRTII